MASLLTIFGLLGLSSGILGYFGFPAGLEMGIKSFINLSENGMVYPLYMNPPVPSIAKYYLYEVMNPRDVLRGEKIKLKLRGPYVYKANMVRSNIAFRNKGETIVFDSRRELQMDEPNSADFDEKFWMLNPILPSVSKSIKEMVLNKIPFQRVAEPIVFNSVNLLLDQFKERLIIKRSPRQILNGKRVQMLDFLTQLAERFRLTSLLPPGPPENTFGIVHFQNSTSERVELFTGVGKSKAKFAEVLRWNDKDKVTFWKDRCQLIRGTNGELYKPFLELGKPLKVFLPLLCRTFELDPASELIDIHDGLKAYEYEITSRLFLGARNNPNNRCFCSEPRAYDCQFDGLINMGPCFFDSPIFLSKPNMLGADSRIRATVDKDSLQEEVPTKQSFYLDPTTGSVLKVNLSLTSVLKIPKQAYMRDMAKLQNITYAPTFIVNETIELPSSITWQIKFLQFMTSNYKQTYALVSASGAGLLLTKWMFFNTQ